MVNSNEDSKLYLHSPANRVPDDDEPAIQISNSQLEVVDKFRQCEILEETGDQANIRLARELRKKLRQPIRLESLPPIYDGIQAHKLLAYLSIFWWLQHRPPDQNTLHWQNYQPYQSKVAQELDARIMRTVISSEFYDSWEFRADAAFDIWRNSLHWQINLKKGRVKNHDGKNHHMGKKEQIWKNISQEGTLATVITAFNDRVNPLWQALDILVETPVSLYLLTRFGKLMSWVQPDQVINRINHAGRLETIVIDYKLGNQLYELSEFDYFGRMQIMLSMMAGRYFRDSLFHSNRSQIDNPPFRYVDLGEKLDNSFSGIRVWHCDPRRLSEKGWFQGIDMTLRDYEIAAAIEDIKMIIRYLHDPRRKEKVKKLLKKLREIHKDTSPTVARLPDDMMFQKTLIPPGN